MSTVTPIYQESSNDCGLACIAMIANYYRYGISVRKLAKEHGTNSVPITAYDMVKILDSLNISSRVLKLDPEEIPNLKTPCILHWKMNHFVILESVTRCKFIIVDPAMGRRVISHSELNDFFTGIALNVSPSETFTARKDPPAISLLSLARGLTTESASFFSIALTVAALEAITLLVPLVSQLVIDGAITSQDKDFLLIAAIGGILLVSCQFLLGITVEIAKLKLSQRVGLRWSSNLFSHLIRLPWTYFQHRQLGEISTRFSSLKSIKEFILLAATTTAIDLIVVACSCVLMAMYNITLLCIVIAGCSFYALARAAFYPFLKTATAERLVLSAKEHAYFLESIRSVLTIKMTGNLANRSNQWTNMVVDVQNRDTATQKIQIMASAANTLIFGIESMLVLYVAGNSIINSQMSIGMLVAFMGFKSHFTSRLSRFIDTTFQWLMQSVNCNRLADIALQKTESLQSSDTPIPTTPLKIELTNISYRCTPQSPWILRNIDLTIFPNESLAIVGRSGSGKSTLIKLILGLLEPSEGQILINGVALNELGVLKLRAVTGTVLQEDQVLSGTISENISGF